MLSQGNMNCSINIRYSKCKPCVQTYVHTPWFNLGDIMAHKKDYCPQCQNLKDSRAKLCLTCRTNETELEKLNGTTLCVCGNKKSRKSIKCRACYSEDKNPIKNDYITCTACKTSKHFEEFDLLSSKSRTRRRVTCRECHSILGSKYHIYRKCNSLGLPKGFALELISKEFVNCGICDRKISDFHIDHCHKTNTYRGLLCQFCNTGLGLFRDNTIYLEKAIEYLKEHQLK